MTEPPLLWQGMEKLLTVIILLPVTRAVPVMPVGSAIAGAERTPSKAVSVVFMPAQHTMATNIGLRMGTRPPG